METVTRKTISVEFQGKKYALQDDATISDLLAYLGLPKDRPVRLEAKSGGFVLILQ